MNLDDIKQRYEPRDAKVFNKNNSALRAELERDTEAFLKKKGKITQLPSCASSEAIGFKEYLY